MVLLSLNALFLLIHPITYLICFHGCMKFKDKKQHNDTLMNGIKIFNYKYAAPNLFLS